MTEKEITRRERIEEYHRQHAELRRRKWVEQKTKQEMSPESQEILQNECDCDCVE